VAKIKLLFVVQNCFKATFRFIPAGQNVPSNQNSTKCLVLIGTAGPLCVLCLPN